MKENSSSVWDVPCPVARLVLTLVLGLLGAWLFPVAQGFFPNPFDMARGLRLIVWLITALAAILLLRRMEHSKPSSSQSRKSPTRSWTESLICAPAIALAAPLLLFASNSATNNPSVPKRLLSRAAFLVFPFALAPGFTLSLLGFNSHRYFPQAPHWLSFSLWTWLGCALLYLLSPWPREPRIRKLQEPPPMRWIVTLGTCAFVAMALLLLLLLLDQIRSPRDLIILIPLLLWLPCAVFFFLLSPWPGDACSPKLTGLPAERQLGPLGSALFVTLALAPFAAFALPPFLYVASGQLFASSFDRAHIGGALDQPSLTKWFFLFTMFSSLLLPYVAIARWLSDRSARLGYWAFALPTLALGLLLLGLLSVPFYWTLQYIGAMGLTPRRLYGVLYGIFGYLLLVAVFCWAVWPPQHERRAPCKPE